MESFEKIFEEVVENGGVATFYAQALREAQGAGRLTERINSDIKRSLAGHGLATVPRDPAHMPTYQWDVVRVYQVDSEVGRVIDAVLTLEDLDPAQAADKRIVESVGGNATRLVQKIRDLLGAE